MKLTRSVLEETQLLKSPFPVKSTPLFPDMASCRKTWSLRKLSPMLGWFS
jgi:hypothetical protein